MKIGVAFCGSGASAAAAHVFADELEKHSVKIDMLSVTSLAGLSAVLWANGLERQKIHTAMLSLYSGDFRAYKQLLEKGAPEGGRRTNLAVSCADAATGAVLIYADNLEADAWNLKALALTGNEREALGRSVSPYANIFPDIQKESQYCDFAIRYGCPFFPLKMHGLDRLLSVSFAGGDDPVHASADRLAQMTSENANLHYTVHVDDPAMAPEIVRDFVSENIKEIYNKLLF